MVLIKSVIEFGILHKKLFLSWDSFMLVRPSQFLWLIMTKYVGHSVKLIVNSDTNLYVLNEAGTAISTVGGTSGFALTSAAFGSSISLFPYVLAIAMVLFTFSTMVSWSYYGLKAWTYLYSLQY